MDGSASSAEPSPGMDAALVHGLIATQFPRWSDLPVAPVVPGGLNNWTFRLGDELSVRLPRAAEYARQVEKEARCLPGLARALRLPIPEPLALGEPGAGYPWRWSVNRWLAGEDAGTARFRDPVGAARSLASFLFELRGADASEGPPPGPHNFYRGGPLTTYADEARAALEALGAEVDRDRALRVLDAALATTWEREPVWVHGDVAPGNLLVRDGELAAVIDFGCSGVGDPACDLTIAWTFFTGDSRREFRAAIGLDDATWQRARGWALWKAAIMVAGWTDHPPDAIERARLTLTDVLEDAQAGA